MDASATATSSAGSVAERSEQLAARVVELLGEDAVTTDERVVLKMSSDWSRMSPVLQEKVPAGRFTADVVVSPSSPQQVADVLRLAFELELPVTPRGAGTGNYGQATPFDGGVLLDLRAVDHVSVGDDGTVTAGAGARLTDIDRVARAAGRDIWIFPSTKNSTVGGFVCGGSAGTGTIEHGTTSDGYVVALTVAPMDGSGELVEHRGEDATPYIHTYGVTGIVVEVEIRSDPAREWVAVYAELPDYSSLADAHAAMLELPVLPRLASGDEPALVPTLPAPVDLDPSQHSLRVIAEASTVADVRAAVERAGGAIVAIQTSYEDTDRLSLMSYNHPVLYFQRGHPDETWFHMETQGAAFWEDPDAVRACYDGPVHLHLELSAAGPMAMVVAQYTGEEDLLAGAARFDDIGVGWHSPHQWFVDRNVELAHEVSRTTDPRGLLNPGKLVDDPAADTRVNIGVGS